jgi:hypothetical protein
VSSFLVSHGSDCALGDAVNKTQVKKLLVAERKSMREKQKQSAFLRKTNNIYRAMKKRAADAKQTLDFTLEELRKWTGGILGAKCFYCSSVVLKRRLTIGGKWGVRVG